MPDQEPREALAQRIRQALSEHGVVREKNMFGVLAFMVDERLVVAAGKDGSLLVRSKPADFDAMIERGAEQAHMANGRSMGEGWLTVPAPQLPDDAELAFWVDTGLAARP